MSEMVGTAAERGWLASVLRRRDEAVEELQRTTSFADLVRMRHAWLERDGDQEAERAYADALLNFERVQGRVEGAYWCASVPAAAALTIRRRRRHFHRALAVHPQPRVTALLNECDELGVRVSEVLRGTGQRIAMGLVLRTAGNLLALADSGETTKEILDAEAKNVEEAQGYYRRAARRQAQLVYLAGMLGGVVVLGAFVLAALAIVHVATDVAWIHSGVRANGTLASEVSLSTLYLCAISGALGANVSVASRIDENSFGVDYELGRFTIASLGALRPLLGAVFGVALYAALVSGLLELFQVPDKDLTQQLYFFLVVAFIAGFSERWTKGVLCGLDAGKKLPSGVPGTTKSP
jgi:hypothetical protein